MMQYWPAFAFGFTCFLGAISAVWGAAMWIAGKLAEQDAKRIELKEAILLELRQTRHTLYGRMDQQHAILDEKIDNLARESSAQHHSIADRMTKLETIVAARPWGRST
jgi:hypothetical protein